MDPLGESGSVHNSGERNRYRMKPHRRLGNVPACLGAHEIDRNYRHTSPCEESDRDSQR